MTVLADRVWRNWDGTAQCRPQRIVRPRDEAQIAELLHAAVSGGGALRCVGTGHSFNRLATTDGTLLDITSFRGVESIDDTEQSVTVRGGTTVRELNRELAVRGLALSNIGTLADQSISGALATGNHGTGIRFGPLSSLVVRLRLVTPDGEVRTVDRRLDPALFRATVTSLGVLGVVSAVTFLTCPAFNLEVTRRRLALADFLDGFDELSRSARHVAFSWMPWLGSVSIQTLELTDRRPGPGGRLQPWISTSEEIRAGVTAVMAGNWPTAIQLLNGRPSVLRHPERYIARSYDGFCFRQPVRFTALEHALPLAATADAVRSVGAVLRSAGRWSPYSLLIRVSAGEDAYLSPAHGRETCYLNLTVPRGAGYGVLHRLIEPPLRELQGRPHWGKGHTATATELRPLYPEWDAFAAIRKKLDPHSTMGSAYLRQLLGD
jgi:L-gulono-1,4-lactone dehydrogenase